MANIRIYLFFLSLFYGIAINAQSSGYYTKYFSHCRQQCAKAWNESMVWTRGFSKATPHSSVNLVEFQEQYKKNQKQWDAMFEWLNNHDLMTIPGGKHEIKGTGLTVSVEDSSNGPLEKRQSESHYDKIDFQWTVKGVERFGVIDHYTSTPNCKYRPDVIHYDYDKDKARFYDSNPSEFFLFFPGDWHIAKVNNDTEDQVIRVIVVKLDYVR